MPQKPNARSPEKPNKDRINNHHWLLAKKYERREDPFTSNGVAIRNGFRRSMKIKD
jgi:hypothetical protein